MENEIENEKTPQIEKVTIEEINKQKDDDLVDKIMEQILKIK